MRASIKCCFFFFFEESFVLAILMCIEKEVHFSSMQNQQTFKEVLNLRFPNWSLPSLDREQKAMYKMYTLQEPLIAVTVANNHRVVGSRRTASVQIKSNISTTG